MKITKARLWEIIAKSKQGDHSSQFFDFFILTLILLNTIAVFLSTIDWIGKMYSNFFWKFEVFSISIFTLEYILRIALCTQNSKYSRPILGRIKFIFNPLEIIDLLAILPFYIPFFTFDLRVLRTFRLLRIIRILKIGRYFSAFKTIKKAFSKRKEELIVSSGAFLIIATISSIIIYYAENSIQSPIFSSAFVCFWWSIATLTKTSSDMFPISQLGKFIESILSLIGIILIALVTGILTIGFSEVISRKKKSLLAKKDNQKK